MSVADDTRKELVYAFLDGIKALATMTDNDQGLQLRVTDPV